MRNYSLNKEMINNKTVSEAHRNRKPHSIHFTHSTYAKSAAFTLAEVLITLGIIGVVAAMTIPTLIANYKEKQTISKLQKTYSTLKNAFEMAKVEHGDYDTWSWNQIPMDNAQRTQYFWETFIFPHLKVAKKCFPVTNDCAPIDEMTNLDGSAFDVRTHHGAFVLPDGTYVYTWSNSDLFLPHVWVYADINGRAKPNVLGKDIFAMYFSPKNPGDNIGSYNDDNEFVSSDKIAKPPYGLYLKGEESGVTLEDLMSPNFYFLEENGGKADMSCPSVGQTCGAAIMLNGWKFPDGYPFK